VRPPTLKAQQSIRTKAALVAAGRALFADRGYADVSAEEVAEAAGVTTGAVYHQFGSKRGLFLAVFEAIEVDVTAAIVEAASGLADPWDAFLAGSGRFLELAGQPEVRQVLLLDGRAVLGWDEWHTIMARYGLGMTRNALKGLMEAGAVRMLPLDAAASLLFGALNEAAASVAAADDSHAAIPEMTAAWGAILEGLRTIPR
jgi:AcrR family transcriptional regulator